MMENFKVLFAKEHRNLEIDNTDNITEQYVTKKFKKKALKVHSDKTGTKDDEEFKELLNDYHKVMDALKEIIIESLDPVKDDIQKFFEHHNFAKEFSQSWTIFVEKQMVNFWLREMRKRFPDPKAVQGNGFQFRTHLKDKTVYSTFYNVEVPKINIQGNHSYIREFVLNELPNIYRSVSEYSQVNSVQNTSKLPVNARIKLATDTIYTCDVCAKTYVRKALFRKHIQTKHISNNDNQAGRSNHLPPRTILPQIEQEYTNDEVIEIPDYISEDNEENTLEEQPEVREEYGPHAQEQNWQCGECGLMFNSEHSLSEHMNSNHVETS